jgi:hypothetical protein
MVDVPDRPDVQVRLVSDEFFFGHRSILALFAFSAAPGFSLRAHDPD